MAQAETIPTTTRRGFLSGAVAAAVLPAAAAPQLIDPIFAVIERHRSAFREFVAASLAVDEVKALRDGREITQEAEDRLDAAVEDGVFDSLSTYYIGGRSAHIYSPNHDGRPCCRCSVASGIRRGVHSRHIRPVSADVGVIASNGGGLGHGPSTQCSAGSQPGVRVHRD